MFIDDVRHAFRRLRSQPGAPAGAVLMLALGIGLTTAMFTVVDALVLRPVPFPNAERLARVMTPVEPERQPEAEEEATVVEVPPRAERGGQHGLQRHRPRHPSRRPRALQLHR